MQRTSRTRFTVAVINSYCLNITGFIMPINLLACTLTSVQSAIFTGRIRMLSLMLDITVTKNSSIKPVSKFGLHDVNKSNDVTQNYIRMNMIQPKFWSTVREFISNIKFEILRLGVFGKSCESRKWGRCGLENLRQTRDAANNTVLITKKLYITLPVV